MPSDLDVYKLYRHMCEQPGGTSFRKVGQVYGKSDQWAANKVHAYERQIAKRKAVTLSYTPPPGANELRLLHSLCHTDANSPPTILMSNTSANSASQSAVGTPLPRTEVTYCQRFQRETAHVCRYNIGKHGLWVFPTCPQCTEQFGSVVLLEWLLLGMYVLLVAVLTHLSGSIYLPVVALIVVLLWLRDAIRAAMAYKQAYIRTERRSVVATSGLVMLMVVCLYLGWRLW